LSQTSKLLERVLNGRSDANINFNELVGLLRNLQVQERIKGSHHIFNRLDVEEILNLQPKDRRPSRIR
jgi:hypothetical protein